MYRAEGRANSVLRHMSRLRIKGGDWEKHSNGEEETELCVWQVASVCACSIQSETEFTVLGNLLVA